MDNSVFNQALHNFINDFASGDAIRHLADKGMSVERIRQQLDFPTPKSVISDIVWQHYINTGVICLEKPPTDGTITKYEYVTDRNSYGRTTTRRVAHTIEVPDRRYVECDFGKRLYKDREGFIAKLQGLAQDDIDYVCDLPWPLETIYHEANERIMRILTKCL